METEPLTEPATATSVAAFAAALKTALRKSAFTDQQIIHQVGRWKVCVLRCQSRFEPAQGEHTQRHSPRREGAGTGDRAAGVRAG